MSSKLLNVEWKTEDCFAGPDCWCGIVSPVENVIDESGNEWDVVISSAAVSKEIAEYIVNLHNSSLIKK